MLRYKAGALPGSIALHQAKAQRQWPPAYEQYWQQLILQYGQTRANHEIVTFLWWAREFELTEVVEVLEACLRCGCCQLDAIKLTMRRRHQEPISIAQLDVASLGQLARYERPMSSITPYDQLLKVGETL